MSPIPNANPYAAYAPVFPATSVPAMPPTIPTPNFQLGQVPQPAQVPTSAGQTPLARAGSADPRCEGLRTVLRASGFADSELPNNFAALSEMVQGMIRGRR